MLTFDVQYFSLYKDDLIIADNCIIANITTMYSIWIEYPIAW